MDNSKFALPYLALWVIQALLSLIETTALFVVLSGGSALYGDRLPHFDWLVKSTTFNDGATYLSDGI